MMFRNRFWVSLLLSIPVLLYSPMIQNWLGVSVPEFPGSQWFSPILATIVFLYGGLPFLQMAIPELRNRQPSMMTLISLAISVAFVYSWAAVFVAPGTGSEPTRAVRIQGERDTPREADLPAVGMPAKHQIESGVGSVAINLRRMR